ncbi:PAS domain-containing protein [Salinigranum sp.]|uniref:PAS domain-containing protein n=1 Tax=Salinigranum sp. TaxID=1966351 RepID=UPI0035690D41
MTDRLIRLLHVDDDEAFAETAALLLGHEREAFSIETVHDVSTALDRLEAERFDCVVSDYEMPGETGLDLLRAVRESDPDVPFVLFTGRGSEEIAAEAISAGVSDYLQKTGGTEQYAVLANRVENLVAGYRNERALRQRIDAIETAREGIALVDVEDTVTYTNRAFAETFGYDDGEVVGEQVDDLFVDDAFATEVRPRVAEAEWTGEVLMYRRDGTELLADVAVSRTAGDELVCTVRDVSADERREHDLFVKNRAMDAAPIGITITDPSLPDNPIVYVNEQFERLTGYSEAEIRGVNHRILQGRETDPGVVDTLRRAIDAAEPVTVELRNYRKDGTAFWNRVSVAPIFEEDGTVTNFVGFQQDVTELVEARRERAAVLDRVSDAFFAVDTDWRFTYLNDRAERLLDRPREELVGQSIWEEFPEAVDSTFFEEYRRALETQETVAFEEYYPPLSTWFEARAYPSESGLSVYFRDVSVRKANERRLEQRTRQFETFGDVLAHDLRTPLSTLDGRLHLARTTGDEAHLDAAGDALERVETLVDDLAQVMREGSVVTAVETVDLESVVRSLWESTDTAEATLDVGHVGEIRADEQALARLLQNLVRNAIEHGGPTVTISVGALDDGSGFFVADDGPGIPESDRERVFEPGYSSKPDGTGFGLVSIRQVAIAHGWELSVTESASGGTRFEVRDVETPDDD